MRLNTLRCLVFLAFVIIVLSYSRLDPRERIAETPQGVVLHDPRTVALLSRHVAELAAVRRQLEAANKELDHILVDIANTSRAFERLQWEEVVSMRCGVRVQTGISDEVYRQVVQRLDSFHSPNLTTTTLPKHKTQLQSPGGSCELNLRGRYAQSEVEWSRRVAVPLVPAAALLAQARVSRDCLLRLRDRNVHGYIGDGTPGDYYFNATLTPYPAPIGESWVVDAAEESALFGARRAYSPKPVPTGTVLLYLICARYSAEGKALRAAARATWLSQVLASRSLQQPVTIDYRFVLGYPPNASVRDSIALEALAHGDLLFVPHDDSYANLSVKVAYAMRWAWEATDARFVAKTDDDVYVNASAISNWLNEGNFSDDLFAGPRIHFGYGRKTARHGSWSISLESYALPNIWWNATNGILFLLGRNKVRLHALEAHRIAARGDVACISNEDLHNGFVNHIYTRNYTVVTMPITNRCHPTYFALGHDFSPRKMAVAHSAFRDGLDPCEAVAKLLRLDASARVPPP